MPPGPVFGSSVALPPKKPSGLLGTGTGDVHLDFHTAPGLRPMASSMSVYVHRIRTRTIRDGEHRTSTSTSTQLLGPAEASLSRLASSTGRAEPVTSQPVCGSDWLKRASITLRRNHQHKFLVIVYVTFNYVVDVLSCLGPEGQVWIWIIKPSLSERRREKGTTDDTNVCSRTRSKRINMAISEFK